MLKLNSNGLALQLAVIRSCYVHVITLFHLERFICRFLPHNVDVISPENDNSDWIVWKVHQVHIIHLIIFTTKPELRKFYEKCEYHDFNSKKLLLFLLSPLTQPCKSKINYSWDWIFMTKCKLHRALIIEKEQRFSLCFPQKWQ